MLILSIIIFAIAAALGVYLLSYVLAEKNTPKGVVMIHGGVAALGIISLIIYSFLYTTPLASLLIFILAALGGFFMFGWDILGHKVPKSMALGHGLIAVAGFILLLYFALSHF
ncbi:hypothetical protein [Legionella jordanis]|uniref:Transmembrane protein n=1 Tax=Legionella jordanis TaxID=456 RepID=A0A0W0V7F7_9GAMM|nr:hypothetical protein [Legionella jordanis]KTD16048.1 hypothetical protein Ljor_0354 [Legionella jordanis]RMX04719.1 hypothetical protein EAW55_04595 [Legionella jordanis]RMX18428.1 hypothetical protein EAS68_08780 [Legionella jordanis]VEH12493.1 Uncharacterised protein [Legionella jordanis]HAT8714003.1 hypothetical protein [Legionella jordanis]